ncbi:4-amino-4-deoxy-L-arabinose transferase-like glycosyltransferase [Sinomonas atrocyanea]|uniref:ArnT family glycosyltransferase n=1 Tax=Sinomonas atrocyanea TaxID=37927 RepID=UPI002788FB30|nr:glycosyltransferase family 39 protein [Sinomonas atrocyanea]MDQ0258720.1 4-amino-4-deoxy-L-arabinose transferase-like glycosyltransferase [Sinomonas atrocyanea]
MSALSTLAASLKAPRAVVRSRWETAALLGGTAVLYLWNLSINGWANAFYSAAAFAGADNLTAFFFGSSDPSNGISVDKPPLALWVMSLSVKIFGLNPWSILVPQALMGVATVWLVYRMAAQHLGHRWGLLAGALMALMPVSTAVFRYNNPDALLTLLMTSAAAATLAAIRTQRQRLLGLAGVMIGAGFLTKQLQVALVAPALLTAVLWLGPWSLRIRLRGVFIALGAAVATAGSWLAVATLTPPSSRPFIGGTRNNSFWELTLGYNGMDRLTGLDAERTQLGSFSGSGEALPAGPIRFIYPQLAAQVLWVLPLAVAGVVMAVMLWRRASLRERNFLIINVLWFICSSAVLASMSGIMHPYYALSVVPSAACLGATALKHLIELRRRGLFRVLLGVSLAATLIFDDANALRASETFPWYSIATLLVGSLAIAWAVLPPIRAFAPAGVTMCLCLVLLGPLLWSASTVASAHEGAALAGGPPLNGYRTDDPADPLMHGNTTPVFAATIFGDGVEPDAVRDLRLVPEGKRWPGATIGSASAARYQLATQRSVLAIGGFDGTDPFPTLRDFQSKVEAGQVGLLIVGNVPPAASLGQGESAKILAWVKTAYRCEPAGHACVYHLQPPHKQNDEARPTVVGRAAGRAGISASSTAERGGPS